MSMLLRIATPRARLFGLACRAPAFAAPPLRFFSVFSPVQNAQALAPERKTTKHVLSRKTFLVDYYKHLNDNNSVVLYVHHNNLVKGDNLKVRSDLQKAGAKLTYIRNRVYNVYLRSAQEQDPALHVNTLKNKGVEHPLAPLLNGPTAVITVPECNPAAVEQVLRVLKQAGERLILIGARVETSVFDVAQVEQFKTLPTKDQLQAQLAGLLTVLGGAGLVRTLESAGTALYLTMEQRRKDLDPEATDDL